MFNPENYAVNEAWIAFQLNTAPIKTVEDGDFNFVALMDATSRFMLSTTMLPVATTDLLLMQAKKMLNDARAHKEEQPLTLILSDDCLYQNLVKEAERRKIAILRVPRVQLDQFLAEEREIFDEEFGQGAQ